MSSYPRRGLRAIVLSACAAGTACGGKDAGPSPPPPPPLPPPSIAIESGNNQEVVAGSGLPLRPTVRVYDVNGPRPDVTVSFRGGRTDAWGEVGYGVSNAQGLASIQWGVPVWKGEYRLAAIVNQTDSVVFAARVVPAPPAFMSDCCFAPFAPVGTALAEPPGIVLYDGQGNGVDGKPILFKLGSGGGTITDSVVITNENGFARLGGWTLGPSEPIQTITAHYEDRLSMAIGIKAAPHSIAIVAGDGQTANVATRLKIRPEARVFGIDGQPLGAGFLVSFSDLTGGQEIGGGYETLTDPTGTARPDYWRLGREPGRYEVMARSFDREVLFTAFGNYPTVAKVEYLAGDGHTSLAGNLIAARPRFRLVDSVGDPIVARQVSMATPGGGTARVVPETDLAGISSIGSWRLGPGAGPQELRILDAGTEIGRFAATAEPVPAGLAFRIDVRFVGDQLAESRRQVIREAAAKWATMIVGDVPDIPLDLADDEDGCFPAIDETIDDLLIYVMVQEVDGPSGILAGAAPCVLRTGTFLPVVSAIILDVADVGHNDGLLGRVALHEIGHALGFGALWSTLDLIQTPPFEQAPAYAGPGAVVAMTDVGRATYGYPSYVPLETGGGPGTRLAHWSQALGSELMTGFVDLGSRLGPITLGAMRDLGYVVNDLMAEPYNPPFSFLRAAPAALTPEWVSRARIRIVDPAGRVAATVARRY